jgi:trk system potassium uptake protein
LVNERHKTAAIHLCLSQTKSPIALPSSWISYPHTVTHLTINSITPESEDPDNVRRLPRLYSRLLAVAAIALVIREVGFVGEITERLQLYSAVVVGLFGFEHLANFYLSNRRRHYLRQWGFHITIALLSALLTVALLTSPWLQSRGEKFTILLFGFTQGSVLLSLGLRALRHQAQITRFNIRPGWLLMGSFALIIVVGTLLLKLPRAVEPGQALSWLDALFTSTSAVCVTGLSVENTANFFTPTGQVIILGLIQVGGLGIMTLTFYLSTMLFTGMSLHDRQILGEMISEKHLSQVADVVRFIVVFTFVTEAIGALLLYQSLPADRGLGERAFQSVFHSISAFCNAGFSTLPDGLADSWVRNNGLLQIVIGLLIILGGIGAIVFRDCLHFIRHSYQRFKDPSRTHPRLRVHTRLVLMVSLCLVFFGAIAIWISEFCLHPGESNAGQMLTALFHSITARTAGFNTVDMGNIGPVTVHILVFLMIIGGSPGGTAGGIRTTVFATAAAHLWNLIRTTPNLVLFRRTLPPQLGPKALAIIVLTMAWLFVNFAVLRQLQPEVTDTRLVFELVSAFATVGLSMNLTPDLTEGAKVLLILNMFVGRIGLITVVSTLAPINRNRPVLRPTEDIILA